MKNVKRIFSLALALMLVMSLSITAFAEGEDSTVPTTGNITIKSSETVSVAGRTFNAYQILTMEIVEGAGNAKYYSVPAAMQSFYKTYFNIADDVADFDYEVLQAIAAMESDSVALFDFAAAALKAAKEAGITPVEVTAEDDADSVTFADLPLGYYVIEDATADANDNDKVVSALMLGSHGYDDENSTDIIITMKADKPSIEKGIDGDNDTDPSTKEIVKYNNTSIGDKVPYVLTSKVPDMIDYKTYTYKVNDTLSKGLTFNNDVELTIGDSELIKDINFSVTITNNTDGTTTVTIEILNFIDYKAKVGETITITYSATVNEDAVIGVEGNPNKVTLIYSNNPEDSESMGKTPEAWTRTYVTEVELLKVDPEGNTLSGAEFTLTGQRVNKVLVTTEVYVEDENGTYWKLNNGTYTDKDPNGEGIDEEQYEDTTKKYSLKTTTEVKQNTEGVNFTAVTGPDGTIKFTGLGAGEYIITEIKSPEGYNLLTDPIKLTIGWTAPAENAESEECTWTYSWSVNGEDKYNLVDDVNNSSAKITVVNKAGTDLPSTGGVGTTMFYVFGAILVLASVVLLVTKKRMTAVE